MDLESSITEWYNTLQEEQKDRSSSWHKHESKPLVFYFNNPSKSREIIFETLPDSSDYGLGKVSDWTFNHLNEYIQKVKTGLKIISDNRIIVDIPEIKCENGEIHKNGYYETIITYMDRNKLVVTIEIPSSASQVWLSSNDLDPRIDSVQKAKLRKAQRIVPKSHIDKFSLVSVNDQHNFSKITKLVIREKSNDWVNETVTGIEINKPKSNDDVKLALKGLINHLSSDLKISKPDLSKILEDLSKELSNED
jgi:hypothetical protein